MYLSVMHFKWTNVVCLSMDMLISSMMDVVIILAKLVCHLCFVCKLNYLFCAHVRYDGITITFQHQWLLCLVFNRGMWSRVLSLAWLLI
jgi:hypothetical protein